MHSIYYNTADNSFNYTWTKILTEIYTLHYPPELHTESFRKIPFFILLLKIGASKFQRNPITLAREIKGRLRENTLSVLSTIANLI